MTELDASSYSSFDLAGFQNSANPLHGRSVGINDVPIQARVPAATVIAAAIPAALQSGFTSGAVPAALNVPSTNAPVELTLEQELIIAKHLADVAVTEEIKSEAFQKVLRIMQKMMRGNTANSMPTSAKLKAWEVPMLQYALEFAKKSKENRWLVTLRLVENLDSGSGFFSINRAKQGLKVIAKNAGFESLTGELESDHVAGRRAAAHLLGWMKREKALVSLLRAYCLGARSDRRSIARIVRAHYSHILPQYTKRCVAEFATNIDSLLSDEKS